MYGQIYTNYHRHFISWPDISSHCAWTMWNLWPAKFSWICKLIPMKPMVVLMILLLIIPITIQPNICHNLPAFSTISNIPFWYNWYYYWLLISMTLSILLISMIPKYQRYLLWIAFSDSTGSRGKAFAKPGPWYDRPPKWPVFRFFKNTFSPPKFLCTPDVVMGTHSGEAINSVSVVLLRQV